MTQKTAQHVATNATYLFISQLMTWLLSLAVAILFPRYLGPAGVGQYHLASSLWSITALVIGFGTDVVITREIARNQTLVSPLVTVGILARIGFHLVGYIALALFAHLAGYTTETIQLIYIFGVANLIFQIGHVFSAALYGLERMGLLSIVGIVTELTSTIGLILLIFLHQSLVLLAAVSIVTGLVRTTLLFFVLRAQHPLHIDMQFSRLPWLLRNSVSILGNRLVRNAYVQADVIFLAFFVNDTVVGWYSIADVVFGSLLFVANIAGAAFFPTLARLYTQAPETLPTLTQQGIRWLLLATVPLGLGTAVVATPLLVFAIGPEFREAGRVLAGFGLVVIVTSFNIFFGQILIALNRQNRLTIYMTVAFLLTLPIDFVLIPWTQATWQNGALGGVIAYLITELLIAVASLATLPWPILDKQLIRYGLRVVVAGAVMTAAVWPFRHLLILYPIGIGVVTYGAMVLLLRVVGRAEIRLAHQLFSHVRQQMGGRLRTVLSRKREALVYLEK